VLAGELTLPGGMNGTQPNMMIIGGQVKADLLRAADRRHSK